MEVQAAPGVCTACEKEDFMGKIKYVKNSNGPAIGCTSAGVIEKDGLFFRDLERTGELVPYEDWRLTPKERALDLAGRLTIEEMAGLMMYSPHQMVPAPAGGPFPGHYDGKPFDQSGAQAFELTDEQKSFLVENHVRHVLMIQVQDARTSAAWNNELQEVCEALPHGIPVSISSDPRHGAGASAEFKSKASSVSMWPEGLGMAACFDPVLCEKFGEVVAEEYRALGITTALGPQIDVGTDPRWMRVEDTFGSSPKLVTELARAYCDGLQTDQDASEKDHGWGPKSVLAMVKHWPGGGACEAGRDAHYPYGKFSVFPGNAQADHRMPFLDGAFKLNGPTGCAASVMPYYTISWDMDPAGNQVGNSYSKYIIKDLLRDKYGFDGVICTDWGITGDPMPTIDSFSQRCYGVENLTEAERHLRILKNDVDQFGGNSNIKPILEAYRIGCEQDGEEATRAMFEAHAARLLENLFRCGLFENPYLDPQKSGEICACEEFVKLGFEAQQKSVVMLKNTGVLPVKTEIGQSEQTERVDHAEQADQVCQGSSGTASEGICDSKQGTRKKVYIPDRHLTARKSFMRTPVPETDLPGADRSIVEKYFDVVDTPEEADLAICFMESPGCDCYDESTGYRPIMLQYRPYTAVDAREVSIAGGDFREASNNRSYRGKTNTAYNETDLDNVIETKKRIGDKPLIAVIRMHNPCVVSEFEPYADAILTEFGVQTEAVLSLICGEAEPSGLLPVVLPKNMSVIEKHCEDKGFDFEAYTDNEGHTYGFGYGMNWSGVIQDGRADLYK